MIIKKSFHLLALLLNTIKICVYFTIKLPKQTHFEQNSALISDFDITGLGSAGIATSSDIMRACCGVWIPYLSTEMQQRCKILAVEKYTSKLFHRSHTNCPNSHLQQGREKEKEYRITLWMENVQSTKQYHTSCSETGFVSKLITSATLKSLCVPSLVQIASGIVGSARWWEIVYVSEFRATTIDARAWSLMNIAANSLQGHCP